MKTNENETRSEELAQIIVNLNQRVSDLEDNHEK